MRKLRVFLVEDNAIIRHNLEAALEELAPVTVIGHAERSTDAVAALMAPGLGSDLAIVDIFLKEGSGIGVLAALRAASASVPCVVLTNYATPAIRTQCLALGAEAVFDKSSDIDALVAYCIERAGGQSRGGELAPH
ncbi:MAG: response regulator [Rubrivivax sp.]